MKLKYLLILFLLILLVLPIIYAQEEEEEEHCGILNLASCLPKKMFEYTSNVFNQSLQPLLSLTKKLLSEPVDTNHYQKQIH